MPACSRSGCEGAADMKGRTESYPRFGSDVRKFRGFTGDHNVYVGGAAVNTRSHVTSLS